MKKIYGLIFIMIFTSCKNHIYSTKNSVEEILKKEVSYKRIPVIFSESRKDNITWLQFKIDKLDINFYLFNEQEIGILKLKNSDYFFAELNFTHQVSYDVINYGIMLFKSKDSYILALPRTTEEFPTFQLLKISNNQIIKLHDVTFDYEESEKLTIRYPELFDYYSMKFIDGVEFLTIKDPSGSEIIFNIFFDLTTEYSFDEKNYFLKELRKIDSP